MTFDELLAQARNDLDDIEDNLRWAHSDGYQPTNADPTRIAGTHTTDIFGRDTPSDPTGKPEDPQPTDPDTVRAPRHDIGVGDHRSRTAYQRTITHLRRAEAHAAIAATQLHQPQPPLTHPTPTSPLPHLVHTIELLHVRLNIIDHHRDHDPVTARRQLRRTTTQLTKAWHTLNHAFERGEANPEQRAVDDQCRICRIRPSANRKGGRCNTCSSWFQRNGYERPTRLDSISDALAARARRRARGEGWGDESLSGTRS